ncbi:MAG: DUF433 domain-containing protein [Acidobacteria bacterium]|nr:DUF433 domain-containing protein [Acidobacteriota bacterium]
MVLDWSRCPAVESVPGKVSGAWVFRGTRIPVAAVFENLEDGLIYSARTQLPNRPTKCEKKTPQKWTRAEHSKGWELPLYGRVNRVRESFAR